MQWASVSRLMFLVVGIVTLFAFKWWESSPEIGSWIILCDKNEIYFFSYLKISQSRNFWNSYKHLAVMQKALNSISSQT